MDQPRKVAPTGAAFGWRGCGVAGGGVAFLAHIGGFFLGLGVGYFYKKTNRSDYTYGSRYGYRDDFR